MKALVRAKGVGGSIMVTVPREIVRKEGIKAGELVEIELTKPRKKPSFFGSLKGIGPFSEEDRWDAHE